MRKPSQYMSDVFIKEYFPAFCNTVKAERTKTEYFSALCLYCDFMKKDFLDQKMSDALEYNAHLSNKISAGKFSKTTQVTRISCYRKVEQFIRDMYGEQEVERCWGKIQMPALDPSISREQIPSVEDIDALLENAKAEGFMWYVIISLVIKCALTASELTHLKKKSFQVEDGEVYIYLSEKSYSFQERRYMKLPKDMRELILSYLATLQISDDSSVFYNKHKKPLTVKNIDDALKRMYKDSDKKYTIKDIRSRGILQMLSTTDNPTAVAEYVGLSQLRMKTFVEAAGLVGDKTTVADYNNIVIKPFVREE